MVTNQPIETAAGFFEHLESIWKNPQNSESGNRQLYNILRNYVVEGLAIDGYLDPHPTTEVLNDQLFFALQLICLHSYFKILRTSRLEKDREACIRIAGLFFFVHRLHLQSMEGPRKVLSAAGTSSVFRSHKDFRKAILDPWVVTANDHKGYLQEYLPFTHANHAMIFQSGQRPIGASRGTLPGYMKIFLEELWTQIQSHAGALAPQTDEAELNNEISTDTESSREIAAKEFSESEKTEAGLSPAITGLSFSVLREIYGWWKFELNDHFYRLKASMLNPFTEHTMHWLEVEQDWQIYKHGGFLLEAISLEDAFPPMLFTESPEAYLTAFKGPTQLPLHILKESYRAVIKAKPFLGKTTLLKSLSLQSTEGDPLALYCSALRWKEAQQSDMLRFIAQEISHEVQGLANPEQLIYLRLQRLSRSGRLLLLVDDVDKLPVPDGVRLMQQLRELGRSVIAVDEHGAMPRSVIEEHYDPRQDYWLFGIDVENRDARRNLFDIATKLGVWSVEDHLDLGYSHRWDPLSFWARVVTAKVDEGKLHSDTRDAYRDLIYCIEVFSRSGMADPSWFVLAPPDWSGMYFHLLAVTALCCESPDFSSFESSSPLAPELEVDAVLQRMNRSDLDTLLEARFLHLLADGRRLRFYDNRLLKLLRGILDAALYCMNEARINIPPAWAYQDKRGDDYRKGPIEAFLRARYRRLLDNRSRHLG